MTTSALTAIETHYGGCRFRSRLEARWAVFFDAIGWDWNYEPQGFATGPVQYLPDFHIPNETTPVSDNGMYVEVKGNLTSLSLGKLIPFCREGQNVVALLSDIPRSGDGIDGPDVWLLTPSYYKGGYVEVWSAAFLPTKSGFALFPFSFPRLIETEEGLIRVVSRDLSNVSGYIKRPVQVDNAYRKARSARFEFGEQG